MSLLISFYLISDDFLRQDRLSMLFWKSLPLNLAAFLGCAIYIRLPFGIWRSINIDDMKDIIKTSGLASLLFVTTIVLSGKYGEFPRLIFILNFTVFSIQYIALRFIASMIRESVNAVNIDTENVLIIGGGTTGSEIAQRLTNNKRKNENVIGFIDDNIELRGKRILGLRVLGRIEELNNVLRKHRARIIIIANQRINSDGVRRIVQCARGGNQSIRFRIVPSKMEVAYKKIDEFHHRELSIDDLFFRSEKSVNEKNTFRQFASKTVLITGAGGSIGSELCYQIAACRPARLIILEESELDGYRMDQELKKRYPDIDIHTVVGNILDTGFMELLFRKLSPNYIYHTAGYKNIPLMEWNPLAAIKNNVLGAAILASLAERYGVSQFVMTSMYKAMRPYEIIGISKRLAERVVIERHPSGTIFNIVRFGDVLGANQKILTLIQQQIKDGGPVTVTGPESKRYFMSISEAVQLILQASTLNESKAIFMLEMGMPIKIVDLVKTLSELSGSKVGEDIEIIFTGIKHGEKIEEILLCEEENVIPTSFEKIRIQKHATNDPDRIDRFIHDTKSNVDIGNLRALYTDIKELIPEMTGPTFEEMMERMFC